MRRLLVSIGISLACAASARAQGIADVLILGSRGSRDYRAISTGGEVLKVRASRPSRSVRGVGRAPDGKVWVVNFIQTNLTVLKPDLSPLRDVTGLPGKPSSIAFSRMDRAGRYRAYVVLNDTNQVLVFDQAVKQVGGAIAITPAPNGRALGCAIGLLGNLWIGIRTNAAPGEIYKMSTVTNKFSGPFRFVTQAAIGGQVYLAPNLRVYSFGDRSRDVFEFDINGKLLRTLTLPGTSSGLGDAAIDAGGTMWVGDWRNGSIYEVDLPTFKRRRTLTHAALSSVLAVALDGNGALWAVQRGSPSTVFKLNPGTGGIEQKAASGNGTTELDDFTGYSYASIVDPGGDNDGDGDTNRAELQGGTNPFNAQSSSAVALRLTGPQFVGKPFDATLRRAVNRPVAALLAFGTRAKAPIRAPIFQGALFIDLATFLPITAATLLPTRPLKLTIPLPNDPKLAGAAFMLQGLIVDSTVRPRLVFSNEGPFVVRK